MWNSEIGSGYKDNERAGSVEGWYLKGSKYWENITADYCGVLGGLEETHEIDVIDNKRLIGRLLSELNMGRERAR